MPKPEVSAGVILEGKESSSGLSLQAERVARGIGDGFLGRMPFIGPNPDEKSRTMYELKRDTMEDAIELTHSLRNLIAESQNPNTATMRVKATDEASYDVLAVTQIDDEPDRNRNITDTTVHITAPGGHRTHLQITAEEVPLELGEQEPEAPKVEVLIMNEAGKFGIEDYDSVEQEQFAEVVHQATATLIEHGEPFTPVRNA